MFQCTDVDDGHFLNIFQASVENHTHVENYVCGKK